MFLPSILLYFRPRFWFEKATCHIFIRYTGMAFISKGCHCGVLASQPTVHSPKPLRKPR